MKTNSLQDVYKYYRINIQNINLKSYKYVDIIYKYDTIQ